MVSTGRVQDASDLVDLRIGPLSVHWAGVFADSVEDAEKGESHDGLVVDDIVLVAERVDRGTGTGGKDGGLGDEGVSWKRVDDRLGLLLWVLSCWNARVVSDRAGQCRKCPHGCSWSETCRPCFMVSSIASIDSSPISKGSYYIPRAVFAKRDAIVI